MGMGLQNCDTLSLSPGKELFCVAFGFRMPVSFERQIAAARADGIVCPAVL